MKKIFLVGVACCCFMATVKAQGLTDMSHSKEAKMQNLPMGSTQWTGGFWGDRFNVMSSTGVWSMWDTWNTPYETLDENGKHGSHGFANFQVAAGTVKGKHHGPPFHDGDMYKWLEACASVYAITKDPKLDALMDQFIEQVALAQRADGYIHTPVVISERLQGIDSHAATENAAGIEIGKDQKHAFASRLNFETYNLGHLMTAGIIHKRATGKNTLFNCGKKAADFLYNFLTNDAAELSRNAICPSHYMGAAEMYRETGDEKYLTLAKGLIAIRDSVKNGEDHNQDRHKFRDQYEAMGHAVRANYLYAGVADLYAETGESVTAHVKSQVLGDTCILCPSGKIGLDSLRLDALKHITLLTVGLLVFRQIKNGHLCQGDGNKLTRLDLIELQTPIRTIHDDIPPLHCHDVAVTASCEAPKHKSRLQCRLAAVGIHHAANLTGSEKAYMSLFTKTAEIGIKEGVAVNDTLTSGIVQRSADRIEASQYTVGA